MEKWLEDYAERLFGGVPAGNFLGMPILVSRAVPEDTIRFVDPVTGKVQDFKIP